MRRTCAHPAHRWLATSNRPPAPTDWIPIVASPSGSSSFNNKKLIVFFSFFYIKNNIKTKFQPPAAREQGGSEGREPRLRESDHSEVGPTPGTGRLWWWHSSPRRTRRDRAWPVADSKRPQSRRCAGRGRNSRRRSSRAAKIWCGQQTINGSVFKKRIKFAQKF